ncbi:hypothetical protein [Sphingobium sp.]|jgi:hypothetical protein|uniref:hypothetical protein n=1 Tax=Sphingobium sp. TaxID=1912891 RepID=UPI003BB5423E
MTSTSRSQVGSNFRRLVNNLQRHGRAMAYLDSIGIDAHLVQSVGLGMKEPYVRSEGTNVESVLAFPLASEGVRRRYAYLNLPEVTVNPEHPLGWGPGLPEVVSSSTRGDVLLVCANAIAVWQVQRAAETAGMDVVAECSSQPGRLPSAWIDRLHWAPYARVVVMGDIAMGCGAAIARAAQRPVERTEAALVDDEWPGDVAAAARLVELLNGARPQGAVADHLLSDLSLDAGDFAVKPISVHGGMSEGRIFYAFTVERRMASGGGRSDRVLHRYQTVVLRSDGALLEATTLPAPAGTPAHRRVHALTDGTRISEIQDPGHYCSWSLEGIRRFVAARQAGEDPCYVDAQTLVVEAVAYLRTVAILPCEDDYWVLVAFVMSSYLFRIFDALPIVHVHGERGSGKSELTAALVAMSFNGQTMSQGSASALVRLVRETGGLVALDDAEALATGGGEIGQALKQGYKQSTAVKVVAVPGGRTQAIDFYGPRVISNTLGLDPILGSRAIRIATVPCHNVDVDGDVAETNLPAWRDAVHAFAMSRLDEVAAAYASEIRGVRNRNDEIWAPLRAVAESIGSAPMIAAIAARSGPSA